MKRLDRLISAVLSALLVLLLSACGTGSGDAGGGTDRGDEQEPPVLAYEIELVGELPESAVGPNAELSFWYVSEMSAEGSIIKRLEHLDMVGPTSAVAATIDARDMADVSLQDFVDWHWGEELTVSDPDQAIKVFNSANLLQRPASGSGSVYSHQLRPVHRYTRLDIDDFSTGYLLFSDQQVTISGEGEDWLFDATLQPGWNLFFHEFRSGEEGAEYYYGAEPAAQPSEILGFSSSTSIAYGALPKEFRGVAAFLGHSPSEAAGSAYLAFRFSSGTPIFIYLPAWLDNASGEDLTSLPGALGSTAGTAESSVDDARFATATLLAFDHAAADTSQWWTNPGLSAGEIEVFTETGNRVIFLYADRNATVHLADAELAALPGTKVSTLTAGLSLNMGWNRIEIEEVAEGTFLAQRYVSLPTVLQVVE